jgi:threonine/homoserine/homoserine lactone efflux protein
MHFLPPTNELLLFVTAALVLLLIPGPAVLYILARSIDQGRGAGLASAAGIGVGTLVHVIAAAVGLSALLVSSTAAYSVLKYAGAVYLLCLGIKKFRECPNNEMQVRHFDPIPIGKVFAQGVVVNVLNPKTAIFFFVFLPQFVSPGRGHVTLQFFTLGMLFAVMGWMSDSMWALAAVSAARWLRASKGFANNQRFVSGTVYVALGLATAVGGTRHK